MVLCRNYAIFNLAIIISIVSATYAAQQCKICQYENGANCDSYFQTVDRNFAKCDMLETNKTGCVKTTIRKENNHKVLELQRFCVTHVMNNSTTYCQDYEKSPYKGDLKFLSCFPCPADMCNSSATSGVMVAAIVFFCTLVRSLS